ncbi:hypothetical protein RI367_004555 [Sorochytrium milnesiophthora]
MSTRSSSCDSLAMSDSTLLSPSPSVSSVRRPSFSMELAAEVRESPITTLEEGDDGPAKINQYRFVRYLGKGAYGTVHLVVDESSGVEYAVKVFSKARLRKVQWSMNSRHRMPFGRTPPQRRRPSIIGAPSAASTAASAVSAAPTTTTASSVSSAAADDEDIIHREIAILKRLHHPNCVKLVEVVEDPLSDEIYMVFEACHGGPIMELDLEKGGPPLPTDTARDYLQQIILGLEYVHEHHIIHRDLKPENLLLAKDGTVKIADFGVSRMFDASDVMNKSIGSPAFLAPEMCTRDSQTYSGCAADIWALGVTLHCMVLGQVPFSGKSIVELYDNIGKQELVLPADMDRDLQDLLHRLMNKDPAKRIVMDDIRCHPWVTDHGRLMLLPKEENVSAVIRLEDLTPHEIKSAITHVPSVFVVLKFVNKLKHAVSDRRRRRHQQRRASSTDSLLSLSAASNAATTNSSSASPMSTASLPTFSVDGSRCDSPTNLSTLSDDLLPALSAADVVLGDRHIDAATATTHSPIPVLPVSSGVRSDSGIFLHSSANLSKPRADLPPSPFKLA